MNKPIEQPSREYQLEAEVTHLREQVAILEDLYGQAVKDRDEAKQKWNELIEMLIDRKAVL